MSSYNVYEVIQNLVKSLAKQIEGQDQIALNASGASSIALQTQQLVSELSDIVSHKNGIYYGSDIPDNLSNGDICFVDNGDGTTTLQQYDGSQWVDRIDKLSNDLIQEVATIPRIYYSDDTPTDTNIVPYSTWFRTSTDESGNLTYTINMWNGSQWVGLTDQQIQNAINMATGAQNTAGLSADTSTQAAQDAADAVEKSLTATNEAVSAKAVAQEAKDVSSDAYSNSVNAIASYEKLMIDGRNLIIKDDNVPGYISDGIDTEQIVNESFPEDNPTYVPDSPDTTAPDGLPEDDPGYTPDGGDN